MSINAPLVDTEMQDITRNFSPGFVVLSYAVSWIGAWTTLELINMRTAGRGSYNWYLLIGSSISMGGIATWAMHFVGNLAILLGDGNSTSQVVYSPIHTALSFFVPIIVFLTAFIIVGSNEKVNWMRVGFGGAMAGLAICGMHYLSQAGISNYTVGYKIANVVGSAIIAVVATITALFVFFMLRAAWISSWWKRAFNAVILAGAVSGMHWVAEVGTQYRPRRADSSVDRNISRSTTVIVVILLSITACFILLVLSLLAQRRRAQSADRAQQVVLATAIFDKDGRLMVTPEGLLPCQKITNSHIERSFDDVFEISHPAFLWIFRISRNWDAILNLLDSMRSHIHETSMTDGSRVGTKIPEVSLQDHTREPIEDYHVIFRELFCVAAADLAGQLHEPLENLGVLYDKILSTGKKNWAAKGGKSLTSIDIERDGLERHLFGRGQLLFLIRVVGDRKAANLQNSGFRFAGIQNVVDILARSIQINPEVLSRQLINMREYAKGAHILEPGIHMAYFSIRASIRGTFDVLVRRDARNQLPTMQMPLAHLEEWQADYLSKFDTISVSSCLKLFKSKSVDEFLPEQERIFATQFYNTLEALRREICDPLFLEAILKATPVVVPCHGTAKNAKPDEALLIAFYHIAPIHFRASSPKLEFIPLSFFRVQQHVYKNSPDHAVFTRQVHRAFGPILNRSQVSLQERSKEQERELYSRSQEKLELRNELEHRLPTLIRREKRKSPRSRNSVSLKFWNRKEARPDMLSDTSRKGVVSRDVAPSEKNLMQTLTFGGILVSQEVSVDVRDLSAEEARLVEKAEEKEASAMEMLDLTRSSGSSGSAGGGKLKMGTLGVASTEGEEDPETYVDKLWAVCVEAR